MRFRHLLLIAAAFAATTAQADAALRAGAATADITPASGGTTLGFVRPDISVTGVHTRLTGRALVLESEGRKVVLLATDLGFALEKDALVARVKDLGFSHETILYTGTHNHAGPGELAPWQVEQLAKAIREADAALEPARAGWGTARVTEVNRNRSIEAHLANHGLDQFYGQGNAQDDPEGREHPRDMTLRLLRVQRPDGSPLAAWTEFPVHLTTSTPAVDVWDADLAGTANLHLEQRIGGRRPFVALWSNGASGDLMPRFQAFNPSSTMDLLGRRIAKGSATAWKRAGRRLRAAVPLDVRWTRVCYCGQEVEPGRRVDSKPVWGLPFLGGSEDGASIFHEPVQTEGKRLPAEAADPVHGRKIQAAPSEALGVHEVNPEVHAIRIGDRLLLGAPGEPSVEMGRRFAAAVRPSLPAGVTDVVIVGLANDYLGYLVTPEEYEMQHYEGGHTVYGTWTSLLMRDSFTALTAALTAGAPAPAPSQPAELGEAAPAAPGVGDGGTPGTLVEGPSGTVERMDVLDLVWTGASGGVDRPADAPFLMLERERSGAWRAADTDQGLGFEWRESDGRYAARYDVPAGLPLGTYRLRVKSAQYDLTTEPFTVARSDGLIALGVRARPLKGGRTRLVLVAQNPAPDPDRSITWRPRLVTRSVVVRGRPATYTVAAGALRDRFGNVNGEAATLTVGQVAEVDWPPNMGVGGGRTPGVGGEGSFPP